MNNYIWAALIILALIVVYKLFDPYDVSFFPPCPLRATTGLLCPGCGSQRAIHDLLNFRFTAAFSENALMVISIPYLILGFIIENTKRRSIQLIKVRKILYGYNAIIIILIIIIGYWIGRNLV